LQGEQAASTRNFQVRKRDCQLRRTFCDWLQPVFLWALALGRRVAGSDICWAKRAYRHISCVAFFPKPFGDLECIDVQVLPLGRFVAGLIDLPMVPPAERHGKFVAHFKPERARLCKTQVMGI